MQIVPLVKLPPSEWKLAALSAPELIGVSIYSRMVEGVPVRHWQRWSILDFPNDLFGVQDLEHAGLFGRYIAAIEKEQLSGAQMLLGRASGRTEGNDVRHNDDGVRLTSLGSRLKAVYLSLRHFTLPTRFLAERR